VAQTQENIANRALIQIGQSSSLISSLNPPDATQPAAVAAQLFAPTFESLARAAHWGCLKRQVALSMVAAAMGTPENPNGTTLPQPPPPWLYAFAYPSDCLFVRSVFPTPNTAGIGVMQTSVNNLAPTIVPGGGQYPFSIAYAEDVNGNPSTQILTNLETPQGIYTKNQPNPVIWDALFQTAMVASLAAFFVPGLSLNLALMNMQVKIAEGAIAQARAADGNEGVHSQNREADWIIGRGCGWNGGNWWQPGCGWGFGYCDMQWPG
jgi:hypothetical protein